MPKLYIVPTPIGNLEDITLRAIRVLKEVDFILAEDTRTSSKLLKKYEIDNKLVPYHMFNEHKALPGVISKIASCESVALISDAGTPAISDPGYLIVRECVVQGIDIETLPGATAFVPALVNSGLPNNKFCFEGFLPPKKGRNKIMEGLKDEPRTMIFYESPHRLIKTLHLFEEFFGSNRKISVSRELTKLYEETVRGELEEVVRHFIKKPSIKGEFVIIVDGVGKEKKNIKN